MDNPEYNSTPSRWSSDPLYELTIIGEHGTHDTESVTCLLDADGYIISEEQFEDLVSAAHDVYEKWTAEEIAEYNAEVSEAFAALQEPEHHKPRPTIPGYVYVLESEGYFKIGCSKNVEQRINSLQRSMPFELRVVGYCFVQQYRAVERALHEQYADSRIRGEWFTLTSEDLSSIRDYLMDRRVS